MSSFQPKAPTLMPPKPDLQSRWSSLKITIRSTYVIALVLPCVLYTCHHVSLRRHLPPVEGGFPTLILFPRLRREIFLCQTTTTKILASLCPVPRLDLGRRYGAWCWVAWLLRV